MNLTSNQEEVEKENDYYAQRPTSPTVSPAISPPIERLYVQKTNYIKTENYKVKPFYFITLFIVNLI